MSAVTNFSYSSKNDRHWLDLLLKISAQFIPKTQFIKDNLK